MLELPKPTLASHKLGCESPPRWGTIGRGCVETRSVRQYGESSRCQWSDEPHWPSRKRFLRVAACALFLSCCALARTHKRRGGAHAPTRRIALIVLAIPRIR